MEDALTQKCRLLGANYKVVRKSAKLDINYAIALGALMFTAENQLAKEEAIRSNRQLLKDRVSLINNLRGSANLSLLAKMSVAQDPEAYLDVVLQAYGALTEGKLFRSQFLVNAAIAMVECSDPADFASIAQKAQEVLEKMNQKHPLLTSSEDMTLATLLVVSGLDIDATLEEAERCYQSLSSGGFLFNKDALQSVCLILALSPKPTEEKCERYRAIREALKEAGSKIRGESLPIIAAFADTDASVEQIAEQVSRADDLLKEEKGFHGVWGVGSQLRRVFASALVLQTYEEGEEGAKMANAFTSVLVSEIIFLIIMIMVLIAIQTTIQASSSNH